MIALYNIFNSYEEIKVDSSNNNAFDYALNKDYSNLYSYFSPAIFDPTEVYFEDKCIGYYDLDNLDQDNHKVSYNLRLFDKSVLPEKFDFHFEEPNFLEKVKKSVFSGFGAISLDKMIIDKK